MTQEEKRKRQRIAKSISVKIQEKDNAFIAETINISASGAYCRTAHPLLLLSEVAINLVVPALINGKKTSKTIECKGTIVRTHPVIAEGKTIGYDVAVFFNELNEKDRIMISEYINHALNKNRVLEG